MSMYVRDTEHAVSTLFDGIGFDSERLFELEEELQRLNLQQRNSGSAYRNAMLETELDDEGIGTLAFWDTRFGGRKIEDLEGAIVLLSQAIEDKRFARAALAGAVLQIAKQGISVVHRGLQNCPTGRVVYGVDFKDAVWQGRNQAMHFEECDWTSRSAVRRAQIFDSLALSFPELSPTGPRACESFGWDVVRNVLGWTEFTDYERDMLSLA